ncbi:hypothetical protein KM043_018095 [Ampulex compressa]|nr:hypothetical protein KM043_018095 [Ampulex compressa]
MNLTKGNARKAKSIKWKNISAKEAQKLEALRNKKKEQLMREIELGALNSKRYRKLWQELLMRAALTDMSERLKIAWATFDRSLDIKDYRCVL